MRDIVTGSNRRSLVGRWSLRPTFHDNHTNSSSASGKLRQMKTVNKPEQGTNWQIEEITRMTFDRGLVTYKYHHVGVIG